VTNPRSNGRSRLKESPAGFSSSDISSSASAS
jgi:hypothetical protein